MLYAAVEVNFGGTRSASQRVEAASTTSPIAERPTLAAMPSSITCALVLGNV